MVADMFGLALRSYQRKVQRLEESASVKSKTLWEAVLEFVDHEQSTSRARVLERFKHDDEASVVAVLGDLVSGGLIFGSGRGAGTLYRMTSDAEREAIQQGATQDTLTHMLWGDIFRAPGATRAQLVARMGVEPQSVEDALQRLLKEGRIEREGEGEEARYSSGPFVIALEDEQGWEAAVFDHFQAMATAVVAKLRRRNGGPAEQGNIGGSTLHFGVHPRHPHYTETLATLARLREQLDALWQKVSGHNEKHPLPDSEMTRVTVYFGQNVQEPETAPDPKGDPREETT
jgi:hypothetical protein